ncbi:MAG: hypothetical protein RML56_15925 [Burkholderiales bacterium]|nr:hypothetical protein [Burkholderiales bacterium]
MTPRAAIVACAAVLAACAAPEPPAQPDPAAAPAQSCVEWFAALDAAIDEAGVRDAEAARIAGYPYLRVNRLLAALAPRAAREPAALAALVERMAALDAAAREHELANLPPAALAALPDLATGTRAEARARTRECARLLRERDAAAPGGFTALPARARVPDAYSSGLRALGLYPLTRHLVAAGVRAWERETRAAFAGGGRVGAPPAAGAALVRLAPPAAPRLSYEEAARILADAARNPLGIPEPGEAEAKRLLAAHAPSFEIEVAGDADRFGRLYWKSGQQAPAVDPVAPVVYTRLAHTLVGDRVLLQLVYTVWFAERPARAPGDIYAGALDGLVWRVTLAPDGEPLVYDSIHPCGCYHLFFPTPRARARPAPDPLEEWAFVPQTLARPRAGERALLRVASGTHYLEGVAFVSGLDSLARYEFVEEEALRSLRAPGGGRRSLYGPDGLVPGTARRERLLLWPMGICSAGAMRQWGRHATAFVGRRHFDDADLIERRFALELP